MPGPKQSAINNVAKKFNLPHEMSQEIMECCFYDTATANSRAIQKALMADVIDHFSNAIISRARPGIGNLLLDPDNREHWAICLSRDTHEEDNEVQFQAISCRVCGNYIQCDTFLPEGEGLLFGGLEVDQLLLEAIPIHMRCSCNR